GSTNNGLEVFNAFAGSQPWQGTQTWNEITDPNNGHVVGASRLIVDPNDPLKMYEVQDQFIDYNGEGGGSKFNPALDQMLYGSTDGGNTWTLLRTLEEDGPLPVPSVNDLPPIYNYPLPEWDRGAPLVMDQVTTNRLLAG